MQNLSNEEQVVVIQARTVLTLAEKVMTTASVNACQESICPSQGSSLEDTGDGKDSFITIKMPQFFMWNYTYTSFCQNKGSFQAIQTDIAYFKMLISKIMLEGKWLGFEIMLFSITNMYKSKDVIIKLIFPLLFSDFK